MNWSIEQKDKKQNKKLGKMNQMIITEEKYHVEECKCIQMETIDKNACAYPEIYKFENISKELVAKIPKRTNNVFTIIWIGSNLCNITKTLGKESYWKKQLHF